MLLVIGEGGTPVPDQLKAFTTVKTSSQTWESLEEEHKEHLKPVSQYNVIIFRDNNSFDRSSVWAHDGTLLVVEQARSNVGGLWKKQGSFYQSQDRSVKFDVYTIGKMSVFTIDEKDPPASRKNEYDLLNDYILQKVVFPDRFNTIEKKDINFRSAKTLTSFIDALNTREIDINFLSKFYENDDRIMIEMMKAFITILRLRIRTYFPLVLETKKALILGEQVVELKEVAADTMKKHLVILLLNGYDDIKRSFYALMELDQKILHPREYLESYVLKIFRGIDIIKTLRMIRGNTFYPLRGLKGSAQINTVHPDDAIVVHTKNFDTEITHVRDIDPLNLVYLLSAQRLRYDESLYMTDDLLIRSLFFNDNLSTQVSTNERMIEYYIHNIYNGMNLVLNRERDIGTKNIVFVIMVTDPWQVLAILSSCASLNDPFIMCQFDENQVLPGDPDQVSEWFYDAYVQTSRTLYIATHYLFQRIATETAKITRDYMKQMFEKIKTDEAAICKSIQETYKKWREGR